MATYLITGCSRGLGFELVKQLLKKSSSSVGQIFATSRSDSPSSQLSSLIKSDPSNRVVYVPLDVTSPSSISDSKPLVESHLSGRPIDILINNAGTLVNEPGRTPGMTALSSTLQTNVIAVHNVTSAYLSLMRASPIKKIVTMTSTLGSIAMTPYFAGNPCPSYKISKAALNMLTAQYAQDLKEEGFTVFAVSPGWLKTDLGGAGADLEPEVGAGATVKIIDESTHEKDNGAFRNIELEGHGYYDGKNPPW